MKRKDSQCPPPQKKKKQKKTYLAKKENTDWESLVREAYSPTKPAIVTISDDSMTSDQDIIPAEEPIKTAEDTQFQSDLSRLFGEVSPDQPFSMTVIKDTQFQSDLMKLFGEVSSEDEL